MSLLPMLRLNTRIGGSDSTPTTALAGADGSLTPPHLGESTVGG